MTEVPEHLLQRSRERRAALGLATGETGAAPAEGAPAQPAAPAEDAAPAAAPARPAAPAPAPAAAPPAPPPPPPPPYVQAARSRPRIPMWAMPVLALLPIWGLIYAGTMTAPTEEEEGPLALGEEVYGSAGCASCHGGDGQGGVGRQLNQGNVEATFPDPLDHLEFVSTGSPAPGTPYGAPDRPGGQHVAMGGMPAFGEQLSEEELVAVVRYEREVLSNAEPWEETEGVGVAGDEPGAERGAAREADPGAGDPAEEAEGEGGRVGGGEAPEPGAGGQPTDTGGQGGTTGGSD